MASIPLTCITCRVVFAKGDLQRDHYRTDWHRYNLKRKVAELPPVSADIYEQKVLAFQEQVNLSQDGQKRCQVCNKIFRSTETLDNHCRSKKHREAASRLPAEHRLEEEGDVCPEVEGEKESDEGESWEDGEGLGLEECLFCLEVSQSIDGSLQHMCVKHGFFIPDIQYCKDIEGLVAYLGEKVALGKLCLWCNETGKSFHSIDAVQKHMRDKGHCKLQHDSETMLEYSDYYDFSSSYPDAEEEGGSSAESDAYISTLEERGWQLVLPSGATVGHRALMRYYKQNLRSEKSKQKKEPRAVQSVILDHYKALGWTASTGEVGYGVTWVECPGGSYHCPDGTTCCPLGTGGYGCCPLVHAVCCSDHVHCCPRNTQCDLVHQQCTQDTGRRIPWQTKTKARQTGIVTNTNRREVCPDGLSTCPALTTCCKLRNSWGCCPHIGGSCCSDRTHCCPQRSRCDTVRKSCIIYGGFQIHLSNIFPSNRAEQVRTQEKQCSDGSYCPTPGTCCRQRYGSSYRCCSLPQGVCCASHCCPAGYRCARGPGLKCIRDALQNPVKLHMKLKKS